MRYEPSTEPGYTIIIPDEGKALVDPNTGGIYCVVGVENVDGWTEIDYDPTQDVDDSKALEILLGGADA